MSHEPTPTMPLSSTASHGFQQEAIEAPEAEWIFAWFKSAMLYLAVATAYLISVIGLVAAWKKYITESGETADVTIYLIAGVLGSPMLLALLFNLLPALRRHRERGLRPTSDPGHKAASSYFITGPREDDSHGLFANGYENFLEWARQPKSTILYLTGLSGSGKSSLITAYLQPRLVENVKGIKTTLLTVRSYNDPLISLKQTLLNALWKKVPPRL